jgi:hypothetical protein
MFADVPEQIAVSRNVCADATFAAKTKTVKINNLLLMILFF